MPRHIPLKHLNKEKVCNCWYCCCCCCCFFVVSLALHRHIRCVCNEMNKRRKWSTCYVSNIGCWNEKCLKSLLSSLASCSINTYIYLKYLPQSARGEYVPLHCIASNMALGCITHIEAFYCKQSQSDVFPLRVLNGLLSLSWSLRIGWAHSFYCFISWQAHNHYRFFF